MIKYLRVTHNGACKILRMDQMDLLGYTMLSLGINGSTFKVDVLEMSTEEFSTVVTDKWTDA